MKEAFDRKRIRCTNLVAKAVEAARRTYTQARVNRSCGIANLENAGGEIDSTKG
jgi:hypothetical protein